MVYQDEIKLNTNGNGHMHRIDDEVQQVITESGITKGLVNIFNVGSTACVGMIEYEPGLERDLPQLLNKLIPASRDYGHELAWHDGNGHSHLQATMMGPSLSVPVKDGRLVQGTWQQMFHLECDVKIRTRTIMVSVIGE